MASLKETDLYAPIKRMLEGQGYVVKGEIGAADVVAVRGDEEPIIVELKTGFSLSLFHQGIARQAVTDAVYVAVPRGVGRQFLKALVDNKALCRRLGLGLITVRIEDGFVEVHADPEPYKPRQSKVRKARLLREFARRVGDPNNGGATRRGIVTSYRQDALKCLRVLREQVPLKAANVARLSGVARARAIMADDHYGWFERVSTGIYALTPKGLAAVSEYAVELEKLSLALMAVSLAAQDIEDAA
ncbi:MAG: DUF2161 family putative PD-(D/E)XK-type phosphodiesterase [Rhizobiaceae bacterium]